MADAVAIFLRAAAFAYALLAAGTPIFLWLFGGALDRSARPIHVLAMRAALTALVLTVAYTLVEPARLAGELRGILDGSLQLLLLDSDFGKTNGIRALGLGMILAALLMPHGRDKFALTGAALVTVSFAMMGHTAEDDQRALLVPLLFAHLIVVAFWFGALWPLLLIARLEDSAVAAAVVARFSRVALRAVPLILVAGVVMAALMLPDWSSLATPYGLLLMAKLGGFALLMVLAALNKWRLGPRIADGSSSARVEFCRVLLVEWWLIFAVVCVTAVMTALFSPGH